MTIEIHLVDEQNNILYDEDGQTPLVIDIPFEKYQVFVEEAAHLGITTEQHLNNVLTAFLDKKLAESEC